MTAIWRSLVASYLRAVAATVGGVQAFDAFGGRGWNGVVTGLLLALISPSIKAVTQVADLLEKPVAE